MPEKKEKQKETKFMPKSHSFTLASHLNAVDLFLKAAAVIIKAHLRTLIHMQNIYKHSYYCLFLLVYTSIL